MSRAQKELALFNKTRALNASCKADQFDSVDLLNSLTLLKLAGGASKFGGTGEMNFGQAYEKASSNVCTSLQKKK